MSIGIAQIYSIFSILLGVNNVEGRLKMLLPKA